MKVLITGGTGFVGQKVLKSLQKNHSLVVLTRNPQKQTPVKNVEFHYWDALSGDLIPETALQGVQGVINLMGENLAAKRWSPKQKKLLERSRIEGSKCLIQSLEKHLSSPLEVFISAGAIGFYPVQDEEITEETPKGEGYLARLCSDWEDSTQKIHLSCQRKVLLRIGVVLGLEGGALKKMLFPFRLGLGGPLGDGRQIVSWIHIDDLVRLIECSLEKTEYRGIYNAVSPHPVSNLNFTKALGKALSRPTFFPVPAFILKALMGEMSAIVLDSQTVIPRRLLGQKHEFLYPDIDKAFEQLLQAKRT